MPEDKKKNTPSIDTKIKRLSRFMYDETDLTQIFGEEFAKNESKNQKKLVNTRKKSNN